MMADHEHNACDELAELVSAYFDRQLEPEDIRRVEEHLAGCPECQRKLEHYEAIREAMSRKVSPPVDIADGLMAQVERDQLLSGLDALAAPAPSRPMRFVKALAAAAILVLIVSASVLLIQSGAWSPSFHRGGPIAAQEGEQESEARKLAVVEERVGPPMAAVEDKKDSAVHWALPADGPSEPVPRAPLAMGEDVDGNGPLDGEPIPSELEVQDTEGVTELMRKDELRLGSFAGAPTTQEVTIGIATVWGAVAATQPATPVAEPQDVSPAELPVADRVISVRVPDTASWMYARDHLASTLDGLGLERVAPGEMTTSGPAARQVYALLPRPEGLERRHRTALLVSLAPERLTDLEQVMDQLRSAGAGREAIVSAVSTTTYAGIAAAPSVSSRPALTTTRGVEVAASQPSDEGQVVVLLEVAVGSPTTAPASGPAAEE